MEMSDIEEIFSDDRSTPSPSLFQQFSANSCDLATDQSPKLKRKSNRAAYTTPTKRSTRSSTRIASVIDPVPNQSIADNFVARPIKIESDSPTIRLSLTVNKGLETPQKSSQNSFDSGFFDEEFDIANFNKTVEVPKAKRKFVRPIAVDRRLLDWSDKTAAKPIEIPFMATPGMKVPISSDSSPHDFFRLLVDKDMIDNIVKQTNRYACKKSKEAYKTKYGRADKWIDTTADEMLVFFAIYMHMGIIRKPDVRDYWSTDPFMKTPIFAEQMARRRHLEINSNLAFNNKMKDDGTDELYKIRPVIDHVNAKIQQIYHPGKELAIDESLVGWKGQWKYKTMIKCKANKYGIKLTILADSNGLLYNIIPYAGSLQDPLQLGQSGAVVMQLMSPLLDLGHSLYLDRFYNSVELALALLRRGTYVTGTIRFDRKGLPPAVVGKLSPQLTQPGQFLSAHSEGLFVCKFFDKREVAMISTEFESEIVDAPNCRGTMKRKPNCIKQYNKHMGGVDKSDQMLSYYDIMRKDFKWHRKLFFRLLDICIHNAWVMYNGVCGKMDSKSFRLEIIRSIYANCSKGKLFKRRRGLPLLCPPLPVGLNNVQPDSKTKLLQGHEPIESAPDDCILCRSRGISSATEKKTSSIVCPGRPGQPHLCFRPRLNRICYLEYHKLI